LPYSHCRAHTCCSHCHTALLCLGEIKTPPRCGRLDPVREHTEHCRTHLVVLTVTLCTVALTLSKSLSHCALPYSRCRAHTVVITVTLHCSVWAKPRLSQCGSLDQVREHTAHCSTHTLVLTLSYANSRTHCCTVTLPAFVLTLLYSLSHCALPYSHCRTHFHTAHCRTHTVIPTVTLRIVLFRCQDSFTMWRSSSSERHTVHSRIHTVALTVSLRTVVLTVVLILSYSPPQCALFCLDVLKTPSRSGRLDQVRELRTGVLSFLLNARHVHPI
jgi:hypothetical protein